MDAILLTLSCANRVGLLAETTGFCASRGLNLLEAHQLTDTDNGWFFTRLEMQPTGAFQGLDRLRGELERFAAGLGAIWMLRCKADRHGKALRGHILTFDIVDRSKFRPVTIAVCVRA
ncbi:MAG: ACT domain-containing protein [Akkermansiaceae bacterium]